MIEYATYQEYGSRRKPTYPTIKVHMDWSQFEKASAIFTAAFKRMTERVRAYPEFARLDLMRWPFPTWAVRSRPFDWRND